MTDLPSSLDSKPSQVAWFLAGMHRSGTSFLARRLQDAGLAFPGDLLPPTDDNPEGYWEARDVVRLNNAMLSGIGQDWRSLAPITGDMLEALWQAHGAEATGILQGLGALARGRDMAIKDPRLCRLLPVWVRAAAGARLSPRLLATTRPAGDVALSLFRRSRDARFAPAAIDTPARSVFLWLRYMLDLEYHSRGLPRRFIPFAELPALRGLPGLSPGGPGTLPGDAAAAGTDWIGLSGSVAALLASGAASASATLLDEARARLDAAGAEHDTLPSGGRRDGFIARALACRPAGQGQGGPVIGFLSGEPGSRGHIYRVENRISALAGEPAGAFRIDPETQSPEDVVAICDLIIVFRRRIDSWQERLAARARAGGVPLVFDIDDLVFDPEVMVPGMFRFLEGKPAGVIADWQARARGYRGALEAASHGWATTRPLRQAMLAINPQVSVLKNGLSDHHPSRRPPRREAWAADGLVLGYASGTPTHDHDFAGIAGPLARLMSARSGVRIEIVGPVGAGALGPLAGFGSRISFRPLVDYFSLGEAVSRFYVNLAPLETGNAFCECKSELKFFEAGIVSVPTVASATAPFREAMEPGEAGLVAHSEDDWFGHLDRLAGDAASRSGLAERARQAALAGYGPARQKRDFLELCQVLLPGFAPATGETV